MSSLRLILLDPDTQRRAELAYELSRFSIGVEPCESLSEILQCRGNAQAIVIFDFHSSISTLLDFMGNHDFWLPVIACSRNPTVNQVVRAMLEGADDYLGWPVTAAGLRRAMRRLADTVDSLGRLRAHRRMAQNRLDSLTLRERDVLAFVAMGYSSREIGKELGISAKTVEIHRANLIKRLGIRNTTEAVHIAYEARLPGFQAGQSGPAMVAIPLEMASVADRSIA